MATTNELLEVFFPNVSEELAEILIAELTEMGAESFWESEEGLRSYLPAQAYVANKVEELAAKYGRTYQVHPATVASWGPAQDDEYPPHWLADGKVYIRSSHHPAQPDAPHELIIEAKLSFGSGHHPTTELCLEWMLAQDWQNQAVLDLGTGSGVLAILAAKVAGSVVAIDNNPWAIEVAKANAELNKSVGIQWMVADSQNFNTGQKFPWVLANLNAQVLKLQVPTLAKYLTSQGTILLSGYMNADAEDIHSLASKNGLLHKETLNQGEWMATAWHRV